MQALDLQAWVLAVIIYTNEYQQKWQMQTIMNYTGLHYRTYMFRGGVAKQGASNYFDGLPGH